MLRFVALCIIGLLMLTAQAFAMRPYQPVHTDPFSEPWRWTLYSELNGQGLRCLAQTSDGTMWFGIDSGVRRYDGQTWTDYTPENGLLGAPIYALRATGNNRLYAGSEQGISLFENGAWRPYFPTKNDLPWPINTLYETPDGQLWAGTPWGALHLHPEKPVLYTTAETASAVNLLAPEVVTQIIPDEVVPSLPWRPKEPYSGLGIRVIEGSWASLRSRNMPRVIFLLAPNSPAQKAGLQIGDYISAVDGIQPAWTNDAIQGPLGTTVTLTIQRPGQAKSFDVRLTRTHIPGEFRECLVYNLMEDSEKVLWFGLARGQVVRTAIGASRINPTRSWQLFSEADGLTPAYGPILLQTQDGTLWTTSQSSHNGLYRFNGETWVETVPNIIGTSMVETRDSTLWVGGRSLSAFHHGKRFYPDLPRYAPHNYLHLIEARDSALWLAGLGEGIARFDYGTTRWQTLEEIAFLCETPDGISWFQNTKGSIICHRSDGWWILGPEDGLIDRPQGLIVLPNGRLMALGYHNHVLATAVFDGKTWTRAQHPNCQPQPSGDICAFLFAQDGSLWFSAEGSLGVFQHTPDGAWHYHLPPEAPETPTCLAQTRNGHIYLAGWYGLRRFDGSTWSIIADHVGLTSYIDALLGDSKGHLWVGTRLYGIFQYDGQTWTRHTERDGVADINVSRLLETADGSILAVTRSGTSRYDGQTWVADVLPRSLGLRIISVNTPTPNLSQTAQGAFYIYTTTRQTVRYLPDAHPPETHITTSLDRVSQPGNTAISWKGSDPWQTTPEDELQYSYRLDKGSWSPFTNKISNVFLDLSSGSHTFEVRTRDRDFNVDPTPAAMHFQVEAPFWRHPAFLTLLALLCAAIALQTRRAIQHSRQLHASHRALETALRDLQASQQRLHTVVTGAPVIFWAIDLQGMLTFLQGKEQEILGLAELDVLGSSVFDLFASNQALCADLHRALQGEAFTSMRDILGTTFEIRHSPLHNAEGHHVGAIGVATDVTERLKAESERLQLDEKLRLLRYLYHLRTALGQARTPAEILEQAGTALSTTLSSAVSAHVSLVCDTCTWATGSPVTAFSYRRPLLWNNHHRGSLTVSTSVRLTESQERAFLDETTAQIATALEARELEAQLLQSARLVSLGQMAAGVAHELNQPLAAISATAEGILLRIEDGMAVSSKRVIAMMEDIMGLVDRMIASINHLRIFSRDTSQEPGGEFSVNNAIRTSLKMIGAQLKSHGIHVALDLAPELPQILGHPHQIEQVMLNLMSNANDAMEEKTSQDPKSPYAKQLQIRTTCSNGCVVIEVTDNGTGIDPDHLPRLFEPFYTTKPADKGTGIGLSIVYAIVQNHGGEITCHSQKGHLTTFRIMLPTITRVSHHDNHRPQIEHTTH